MIPAPAGPILVFGPAYLDRVIRVDRPLLDPGLGLPPLDRSVDGTIIRDAGGSRPLRLVDPERRELVIAIPETWPGGFGAGSTIVLSRRALGEGRRAVRGLAWSEALGGMGAGFAACLGGTLVGALGSADDPISQDVIRLLGRHAIRQESVRLADRTADWTLLISSGPHGDKLPVGFRGCHAAWTDFGPWAERTSRIRVVAALPNRVVPAAFGHPGASRLRAFFPNARNMLDRVDLVAAFAGSIDFLSCNRGEWDDLGSQTAAVDRVPIVAITAGPRGAAVRFFDQAGQRCQLETPAWPRSGPIVDTNRAGEAFAATMLATLAAADWTAGPVAADLVRMAARRGSAAAALVIGRGDFGFPSPAEIDRAVASGRAD